MPCCGVGTKDLQNKAAECRGKGLKSLYLLPDGNVRQTIIRLITVSVLVIWPAPAVSTDHKSRLVVHSISVHT
jgi:hypothetical protein